MMMLLLLYGWFALLPAQAAAHAKHVVLIGIDGWGAYSVPKAENIPNIKWLMQHGAWTLHKRSCMPTSSAINWASMFNGGTTEEHGYDQWDSRTPTVPSAYTNHDGYFPTIYSILREQRPEAVTANLCEWDGVQYVIDAPAVSKVATYDMSHQHLLCDSACAYLKAVKPTFAAICFDQLDHTGHAEGHDTPAYYATLERIDTLVGKIMQAVRDAGMWDETVILMAADHGGVGKGHGNFTLQELETPFIACGKDIKQGFQITDVMIQPDVAATIAEIFGLRRPQCWRGQPIYSIFRPQHPIRVTYRVVDGDGRELITETVEQEDSSDAVTPASFYNSYVTLSRPDRTMVTAHDNVVTYTATVSLPFKTSTGYDDATWYYMKLRGKLYAVYGETAPYTLGDREAGPAGQWAFVGNPYRLQVINRAAGKDRFLQAGDVPVMAQASDTTTWWVADASQSQLGGFTLKPFGSADNYLNDRADGGKLKYWPTVKAISDDGSAILTETTGDWVALLRQNIDKVKAGFGTHWGDETASAEFMAAEQAFDAHPTQENYDAVMNAPKAYVGSRGLVNIANTSDAGRGYSIGLKAGDEDDYIHGEETNLADANQLWLVTSVKKGYVRLYNPNARQYIGAGWDGSAYTTGLDRNPVDWRITWDEDSTTFRLNNGGSDTQYLRFETSGGNEGNLNRWNDNATWQATEVDTLPVALHRLGDMAYATLCYPFAVTLTGGEACTASLAADGKHLSLHSVGRTVPAFCPVVVRMAAAELAGDTLAVVVNAADTGRVATDDNVLQGALLPMTIAADGAYTLGQEGHVAGFYHHETIIKNAAYYRPDDLTPAAFPFDHATPTTIQGITPDDKIKSSKSHVQLYNLAGQRVSRSYRGVAIVNGKKRIVK